MRIELFGTAFAIAQKQAQRLLGNRTRLVLLLSQLGTKLATVERKGELAGRAKEKVLVFWRLLRAIIFKNYRGLSWKAVVSVLAALIYFVNPADVIPDFVPLSGLLDDFSILIWTYNSFQAELEKFLDWESDGGAL
ncbi:MAG TPA: YkvA family protein [Cyclobacteriaceae bacterium]|nr:YkvA family protein [Cyclobacteriaceae bacterium]